jgi:hypothetical protein
MIEFLRVAVAPPFAALVSAVVVVEGEAIILRVELERALH